MKADSQPVTLKQLADELGLSVTTVSLVLNGRAKQYGIAEKTVALVAQKARDLEYAPNEQARNLRMQRSGFIGVVFPHLLNSWAHDIMEGMYGPLEDRDMVPFISNHRGNRERERNEIDSLIQRRAAGIICCPADGSLDIYRSVAERGIPLVFLGDILAGLEEVSYSAWDPADVSIAVRHLIDAGCRKLAYLGVKDTRVVAAARHDVFQSVIQQAGLEAKYAWNILPVREESIAEQMREVFEDADNRPDGLFCLYCDQAMEAMEILEDMRLKVPGDVKIATLGDRPLMEPRGYDITTVRAPVTAEGRRAAEIILQLIDDPSSGPIQEFVRGGELVVRGSTGKARS
ncbi:MAG: LacI family transcriptional regulator [Verrucomicrobia bacterium]|nr:LacI family transcriptional regulator [Verrucomicrobiota bacterium]